MSRVCSILCERQGNTHTFAHHWEIHRKETRKIMELFAFRVWEGLRWRGLKKGKLGSVLHHTVLTSGIILTFYTFKEMMIGVGGAACRGGVTHSCISNE